MAMRYIYPEFYKPSKRALKKIWSDGIFVFDSSVLLGLYRYSSSTRDDVFALMEKIKSQLWMPHQVGYEFHKNRSRTIFDIDKSYDLIISELVKPKEPIRDSSRGWSVFDVGDINSEIDKIVERIKKKKAKYSHDCSKDSILKKISKLFHKKIGKPFSEKELADTYNEGEKRYSEATPPGYMDANKDQGDKSRTNKFGDLIIWKQMITKSKTNKKPIIFVTDDQKEDWWKVFDKRTTVGPRPELVREFKNETKSIFYMYNTRDLLKNAPKFVSGVAESPNAISEIEQISVKNREAEGVSVGFSYSVVPEVGTSGQLTSHSINLSDNIEIGTVSHSHIKGNKK